MFGQLWAGATLPICIESRSLAMQNIGGSINQAGAMAGRFVGPLLCPESHRCAISCTSYISNSTFHCASQS